MATKKTATGKKGSPRKKVSIDLIQKRAQEIYLKRIEEGTPGDADSDWFQAEEELSK